MSVAQSLPLRLEEAERRASLLRVERYRVHLDLARGPETFRSTCRVHFTCTEPGASTFVELKDATLLRATLNGSLVGPLVGNRIDLTGLAADNELVVEADLPYVDTGEGMHRYVDPADGNVYVGGYLGVDNTQRTFACFDQPDLKAVIELEVTAPRGWTVGANSVAVSGSPDTGAWRFAPTPPISTYLFAIVAGPWETVETVHAGIPFTLYARASLRAQLEAEAPEILEVTTACFDHYHRIFGQPYPFDSYGQAFVPELNWGAMESPGCITFRDEFIFRGAVTESQRVGRAMVIAHEMAHMWFGNLVTLRWWDDIWLNESFAEYMGFEVTAAATRFTSSWTDFSMARKTWGYDSDQRVSTHPVAPLPEQVTDTETALANFDGISYAKGASVLRQLVAWLGESEFLAGVNAFLDRFAFGSARFADLLDALGSASGRDVHAWAEQWLRNTGVDTLLAVREPGALRVEQSGARPHLIRVGRYDLVDGSAQTRTLALRARPELRTEAGSAHAELPTPDGPADVELLNDDDLSFAKLRLDPQSHAVLLEHLGTLPDPVSRAVAWTYLRDLLRDGELPATEYLHAVERALPMERNSQIAHGVLQYSQLVANRFLPPGRRAWGLDLLHGAATALAGGTDDLPLIAVRARTAAAHTPSHVEQLRRWLETGRSDEDLALDADLRWRILARLSALGAAAEPDILAELERDPTGLGLEGAARCRAALPNADSKARAWELMVGTGPEASNYIVMATAESFWQPDQVELLAPFVDEYFARVQRVAAERGAWLANAVAGAGFPFHEIDERIAQATAACIEDPATTTALRRKLTDSLDEYRRILASRQRYPD